jgi:hypothetical protein
MGSVDERLERRSIDGVAEPVIHDAIALFGRSDTRERTGPSTAVLAPAERPLSRAANWSCRP